MMRWWRSAWRGWRRGPRWARCSPRRRIRDRAGVVAFRRGRRARRRCPRLPIERVGVPDVEGVRGLLAADRELLEPRCRGACRPRVRTLFVISPVFQYARFQRASKSGQASVAWPGALELEHVDLEAGAASGAAQADAIIVCKVRAPTAPGGRDAKDAFAIDVQAGTVTCPAGRVAPLRTIKDGRIAHFGQGCATCPRPRAAPRLSTDARSRRSARSRAHPARAHQTDPAWQADYNATRPKVEQNCRRSVCRWVRRAAGSDRRGRARRADR
jgi:hypothetical protein